MRREFEEKYVQLENELELVALQAGSPLERMTGSLRLIRVALGDLRAEVLRDGFKDREAEVVFFKEVKPAFYALQVLELELFNLVSGKPAGGQEVLRSYYLSELQYVERFFNQQACQYQYYRLGASELDGLLFCPGCGITERAGPGVTGGGSGLFDAGGLFVFTFYGFGDAPGPYPV